MINSSSTTNHRDKNVDNNLHEKNNNSLFEMVEPVNLLLSYINQDYWSMMS